MSDTNQDKDEMEHATGYHFTHFDCPHCSEAQEAEGDIRGEVVTCQDCGEEFRVV